MNLTELLVTQKNVDEISAQFGLTEEQTLESMAAVIPAFSEGLKRNTSSLQGTARFVQALSSGQHAHYADDPSAAMNAAGIAEGSAILGHLFGNKNVSRAVARQAAASTGISADMFKSLLPVMASMVMGSLFKGATGGSDTAAAAEEQSATEFGMSGGGLLGQIIESLAGGLLEGAQSGSTSRRRRTASSRKRAKSATRKRRRQNPTEIGLGGLLDHLLGSTPKNSRTRRSQNRSTAKPSRSRRQNVGLGDIFGNLLEPGGDVSQKQQKQTGSIFDEFLES